MPDVIPASTSGRRQLQQIIVRLNKGVVLIDPDQSISWTNDAALVMYGLQDVDALGVTQLCINSAFSVIIGIGLFFIGVPNPILWGILSILLRFVPYVGSFIAAVLLHGGGTGRGQARAAAQPKFGERPVRRAVEIPERAGQGAVHRRARAPGRGGVLHAGSAARQARWPAVWSAAARSPATASTPWT